MRKWLHDHPWIWIVVLLGAMVLGGLTTVVIAQLNRPEVLRTADLVQPRATGERLEVTVRIETPAQQAPHVQRHV